jgi:hypothetical protein
MEINKKQLCDFLVKAKKAGYASGSFFNKVREKDKSHTIRFKLGDWGYHDNYFGGEPFGGREVVFYKNKPVFIMTYYGFVDGSVKNVKEIYKFLREVLGLIPEDKPFRGPKNYKNGDFVYLNNFKGDITNFFGEEVIKLKGKKVYTAKYIGGLVDQRN